MSDKTIPAGFAFRSRDHHYETPHLEGDEVERQALALLAQFDGQPVVVIRAVLRRADFWLDATTKLDCGASTEFARAVEGWTRAPSESA